MKKDKKIEEVLKNYNLSIAKIKNIELDLEALELNFTTESDKEKLLNLKKEKTLELEKINNAINNLDDKEKKIIQLRYFDKMTWIEISNEMNLSQTRSSVIRTKAINKMKNIFSGKTH